MNTNRPAEVDFCWNDVRDFEILNSAQNGDEKHFHFENIKIKINQKFIFTKTMFVIFDILFITKKIR